MTPVLLEGTVWAQGPHPPLPPPLPPSDPPKLAPRAAPAPLEDAAEPGGRFAVVGQVEEGEEDEGRAS